MQIFSLTILFFVVALASWMTMSALVFFAAIGFSICVYAKLKGHKASGVLFKSGAILVAAPATTFFAGALLVAAN